MDLCPIFLYNKVGDNMKIAIASDHRGYELKEYIKKNLKDIDFVDLGTDSTKSVDYPKYAFKLGEYVVKNHCLGIVICGSGLGISIACNKVQGVRCAKVNSIKDTRYTRMDNNANVISLSAEINRDRVLKIVHTFVTTEFTNLDRHVRRINQIYEYESKK